MSAGSGYEKKQIHHEDASIRLGEIGHTVCAEVFDSHWHEQVEIHWIIRGGGVFHMDGEPYLVQPGDVVVANRNELHAGQSTVLPYEARRLVFDPSALSGELGDRPLRFQPLIRGDAALQALLARLFEEQAGEAEGYRTLCRALATELLVYLCRHYVAETLPPKESLRRRRDLERLGPALHYIDRHYAERISVAHLAQELCLSPDRLGHLFRDGVGQAPLQYINEIRLRKAMQLLRTRDCPVTEVAQAVGFFDYNHFGRLFRRRYGCTPHQVRQGKGHPTP